MSFGGLEGARTCDPMIADRPVPGTGRPLARWALLTAAAAVCLLLTFGAARPASAHGGDGQFEPISVVPSAEGDRIDVTVRLTYANDGDPVTGAEVFVGGTGPEGVSADDTKLEAGQAPGTYTGSVAVDRPGTWTLTLSAADPPATLDLDPQEVPEPPPTTEAEPEGGSSVSDEHREEIIRQRAAAAREEAAREEAESGTSGTTVLLVVGGVVVVVGVLLGLMFWMRGRRSTPPGDPAP